MKIAIVSDFYYPELSGIADSIILQGKALAARGHQVLYLVPSYAKKNYDHNKMTEIELDLGPNVKVKRLPSIRLPHSPTGQGRIVIPVGAGWREIKKFRPDVIHAHSPYGPGIEAWLAAKFYKIPLIGTNHTPPGEFMSGPQWLINAVIYYNAWYYNRCRYVSTPCQSLLDEMRRHGFKQPARPIPNPINLKDFIPVTDDKRKKELKKHFNLSGQTVLYTGRLSEEKHIDIIIKAIAKARTFLPEISLAATGRGSAERELKKLAKDQGLQQQVTFLGFLPDRDFVNLYQASDLFVIMSTAESQSLSLMQAMACGLPVIGARARALPEYISPESGLIVDVADTDQLADHIVRIFTNSSLAKSLGAGGMEQAAAYEPAAIAGIWEKIYNNKHEYS